MNLLAITVRFANFNVGGERIAVENDINGKNGAERIINIFQFNYLANHPNEK